MSPRPVHPESSGTLRLRRLTHTGWTRVDLLAVPTRSWSNALLACTYSSILALHSPDESGGDAMRESVDDAFRHNIAVQFVQAERAAGPRARPPRHDVAGAAAGLRDAERTAGRLRVRRAAEPASRDGLRAACTAMSGASTVAPRPAISASSNPLPSLRRRRGKQWIRKLRCLLRSLLGAASTTIVSDTFWRPNTVGRSLTHRFPPALK